MGKSIVPCALAVVAALGSRPTFGVEGQAAPGAGVGAGETESLTLLCPQVPSPPRLDGDLSDGAWQVARPLRVFVHQPCTSSGIGSIVAELRACWSGENIYMAVRWPDPSASLKKDLWTFDGSKWTKDPNEDEDRLALTFPIGQTVPGFRQGGCASTCHGSTISPSGVRGKPRWYHRTNGPQERMDSWHWKSVRSNPLDFVDDKYWDNQTLLADVHHGGRHFDAEPPGQPAEQRNSNKEGTAPSYMQDPGKPPSVPGFLLRDEVVPIDLSRFKKGDVVPGRITARAGGSRGDISCKGVHRDGHWNLELCRKLCTGHDDDVVFEPGQSVPFVMAVFENLPEFRKEDHGKVSEVLTLEILE